VLQKALANLAFAINVRNAVITTGPLPTVGADDMQLIQLFQNLVDNAIKYCIRQPRVHISSERKDGLWLFSVGDNGIGIKPEQFGRIFEVFQRLHSRDEYPGTGVGLSICKKIVERHGGRIWVEGSTFFFTIPQQPAEH
jgi:light-regulated signal transduction histidine kinase (bacteriophytochrome)